MPIKPSTVKRQRTSQDGARPSFCNVIQDNEEAAATALAEGRFMDAFLLVHTLIEGLLRAFLNAGGVRRSFNEMVQDYERHLKEEGQTQPQFVDDLREFNQRRNRIVHQLWERGHTDTNKQSEEAAQAAVIMYGLFIEWLETFDPEITTLGFSYEKP